MAAVHNGHINILRKLIKLGYTDKKAITSITIQDVLKMNVSKGEMRSICERALLAGEYVPDFCRSAVESM